MFVCVSLCVSAVTVTDYVVGLCICLCTWGKHDMDVVDVCMCVFTEAARDRDM